MFNDQALMGLKFLPFSGETQSRHSTQTGSSSHTRVLRGVEMQELLTSPRWKWALDLQPGTREGPAHSRCPQASSEFRKSFVYRNTSSHGNKRLRNSKCEKPPRKRTWEKCVLIAVGSYYYWAVAEQRFGSKTKPCAPHESITHCGTGVLTGNCQRWQHEPGEGTRE